MPTQITQITPELLLRRQASVSALAQYFLETGKTLSLDIFTVETAPETLREAYSGKGFAELIPILRKLVAGATLQIDILVLLGE